MASLLASLHSQRQALALPTTPLVSRLISLPIQAWGTGRRARYFPLVGCQFSTTVIGRAGPVSSGGVAMRNRSPSGVTS